MNSQTNISDMNRALSVAGGVAALAAGAKGGTIRRLLMVPLGLEMIRRGVSGHCFLSEKLNDDRTKRIEYDRVDEMSDQSFPASDPPAYW